MVLTDLWDIRTNPKKLPDLILLMLLSLYFALNVTRIYNTISTFSYKLSSDTSYYVCSATISGDLGPSEAALVSLCSSGRDMQGQA